ncbi:hypothetical protein F4804DRAFT_297492 [Jackrogersella minutella]|nr:hypothetical protein F4804DRAFT_297492 [Jackrogersella minutella]
MLGVLVGLNNCFNLILVYHGLSMPIFFDLHNNVAFRQLYSKTLGRIYPIFTYVGSSSLIIVYHKNPDRPRETKMKMEWNPWG